MKNQNLVLDSNTTTFLTNHKKTWNEFCNEKLSPWNHFWNILLPNLQYVGPYFSSFNPFSILDILWHGWQKLNPVYLESACEIHFNLSFNLLWFYNTFLTLEFLSNGVHGINFVKNKLQVHHLTRTLANQDQMFWSAMTLSNMPQVSSRRKV